MCVCVHDEECQKNHKERERETGVEHACVCAKDTLAIDESENTITEREKVRGRGREQERVRERKRETKRQRDKETKRQRDKEREREREKDTVCV